MFWKMGWNVLDFFIVVALLLGPCKFKKHRDISLLMTGDWPNKLIVHRGSTTY